MRLFNNGIRYVIVEQVLVAATKAVTDSDNDGDLRIFHSRIATSESNGCSACAGGSAEVCRQRRRWPAARASEAAGPIDDVPSRRSQSATATQVMLAGDTGRARLMRQFSSSSSSSYQQRPRRCHPYGRRIPRLRWRLGRPYHLSLLSAVLPAF